jgi:hypothetical protein
VAAFDSYPAGLSFYRGRTVTLISDNAEPLRSNFILYWLQRQAVRPATIVAGSAREEWRVSRTSPAYLVASETAAPELAAWLGANVSVAEIAPGWSGVSLAPAGGR